MIAHQRKIFIKYSKFLCTYRSLQLNMLLHFTCVGAFVTDINGYHVRCNCNQLTSPAIRDARYSIRFLQWYYEVR